MLVVRNHFDGHFCPFPQLSVLISLCCAFPYNSSYVTYLGRSMAQLVFAAKCICTTM
jgi:hypothetical protein